MGKIIFFRLGERDRISVHELVQSIRNVLGILEDLDASISQRKSGSMRWEVAVLRKDSPPLIGIEGCLISHKVADPTPLIQREVLNGLRDLTKAPERSRYYSDSVLGKIRNLAYQSKRLGPLKVYTEEIDVKQETVINESTFKNIEQLIGVKYKGFGSVIGSLDAITVHKRNEFRIWNENTGKPVTCLFGHKMLEKVKDSLQQKVLVYGEVNSNQRGEPVSILVDGIEPRSPKLDLPTIKEMSGLVKDMYEGKTLKEYLEDIKND
jgi:hypothetical protein